MSGNRNNETAKSQLDKFKQAARDLECDDDDQRFKEKLGKLAKAKLKTEQPK